MSLYLHPTLVHSAPLAHCNTRYRRDRRDRREERKKERKRDREIEIDR
jgi:hypothetical protein